MELVNGGDLMHYAMKMGAFSEKATTFYTAEIAYGLLYVFYAWDVAGKNGRFPCR